MNILCSCFALKYRQVNHELTAEFRLTIQIEWRFILGELRQFPGHGLLLARLTGKVDDDHFGRRIDFLVICSWSLDFLVFGAHDWSMTLSLFHEHTDGSLGVLHGQVDLAVVRFL